MPNYFKEPEPRTREKRTRLNPISAKQSAKRKAAGEAFLGSTISKPKSVVKIRSVNVKAAKKRKDSYRKKLAAYRRSETYKQVEQRAGGRCERYFPSSIEPAGFIRCHESRASGDKLTHNHLTYARFGGKELPQDIEVLGPICNAVYESEKRPWNRGRAR